MFNDYNKRVLRDYGIVWSHMKVWEVDRNSLPLQKCRVTKCYRDGCRTGVLVSNEASSNQKEVAFSQKDAIKRPKELEAKAHQVKVKGLDYLVIVSLMDSHPYEVFVIPNQTSTCSNVKVIKENKGLYNMYDESGVLCIEDIGGKVTDEESAIARLISTSLRHGTDVRFVVEQLNKSKGSIIGFSKAISRALKYYIFDGVVSKELCPECNQPTIIYEEGCKKCKNCSWSKCG